MSEFIARCDVDGCTRDAWWTGAPPMQRVNCPDHPTGWPATPLPDTRTPARNT